MNVLILLASGEELAEEALVYSDADKKLYRRYLDGDQQMALDTARIGKADEDNPPFDPDAYAAGGWRWGMFRVVDEDGKFNPGYDGKALPTMKKTTLPSGEKVFQITDRNPPALPSGDE